MAKRELIDRNNLESTTIVTDDFSGNELLDVVLMEDVKEAPVITEQDIVKSVLEKLKADISKTSIVGYATVDGKIEIARRAITQIIDKYILESEDKDGNNNQHN